jgi:hypothetical protein
LFWLVLCAMSPIFSKSLPWPGRVITWCIKRVPSYDSAMTVHCHCNVQYRLWPRRRRTGHGERKTFGIRESVAGLWQWFALGKAVRVLFVTSNRCIPVEGTGGWSAVVFFSCEIIELFSVVFCVVRTVQKFDSRPVLNETRNKWRPVFITETCVMQRHRIVFVTGSVFSPDRLGDC